MSKGYVYVLSNPVFHGIVKIGCTRVPMAERMMELYSSPDIPMPFRLEAKLFVPDAISHMRRVHWHLAQLRVSPDRNFFACHPNLARFKLFELAKAHISAGCIQAARDDQAKELIESRAVARQIASQLG